MWNFLTNVLNSDSLSPHGICLLWRPELIWLHVGSDLLIGMAYFSIPIVLSVFVSKRPDIVFSWVFWAFAVFILACGTTHFFSIWTLFVPDYGLEGLVKVATALVSVVTAIGIWPLLPKALALPSPDQLRRANEALRAGIAERDAALEALKREKEERLRTEEQLRQAQKLEAIGQLTAGIAHDFNNLLTVVIGNVDRAKRRIAEPAEASRALEAARTGAERAAVLTQRLLAFGRNHPHDLRKVDVNDFVRRSAETLGRTLGEKIQIELNLAKDLWPTRIDPIELENALLNLALNSRDAMPLGGRLTLTTRNAETNDPAVAMAGLGGRFVEIAVVDQGDGMPPEVAEHAFEPFFTTKPVGTGSGLGLSQVYGFARQSRGAVLIDSAPERGTTVRFYLPKWEPAAATTEVAPDFPAGIAVVPVT